MIPTNYRMSKAVTMFDNKVDYPAAHSTDTRWFAIDEAGEIALFFSDADVHHVVPEGLPHAGGGYDFAWPNGWPEWSTKEWNSLHHYAVTDESHGIYQRVKSPSDEVTFEVIRQKVDSMFLQPLPLNFHETDWIVPHHFVCCEIFGEALGQFELGDLSQVAFVDLDGRLSPLPKSVGDPRAFFSRLADLAIWSAQFQVPLNRAIRGLISTEDYWRVLGSTVEELQCRLTTATDHGDELTFERVAAGLENLFRLYDRP